MGKLWRTALQAGLLIKKNTQTCKPQCNYRVNFQGQMYASKVRWQEHKYTFRRADSWKSQILRLYLFKQTIIQVMVLKEVQSGEIWSSVIWKTVFCWNSVLLQLCDITLNKSFKERIDLCFSPLMIVVRITGMDVNQKNC